LTVNDWFYNVDALPQRQKACASCTPFGLFSQDDSKVKIKVAAQQFPFVFKLVFPATGVGWHETEM
jgi:hypothetical protein